MRKLIILLSLILMPMTANAFSSSLDELYRTMLVEDYEGTLPPFVINRKAPEFEASILVEARTTPDFLVKQPDEKPVEAEVTPQLIEAIEYGNPEPIKKWLDIVAAVQRGNPSPFDIAEIRKKAEHNNIEAVELIAWIYANGIGTKQDLHKAWEYYSLAARLGVASAGQNANAVWRAMNAYQKQTMSPF